MVDELLRVLRMDHIGKKNDAKEIEEVYLSKIAQHVRCKKCR